MYNQHPPSSIRRLALHILCLAVIFSLLAPGCTSLPPVPSSPFRLDQLDTSPLQGKVIMIDPGHGGKYGGAAGKTGLKESEVNLGVALYLWGALQSAGVNTVMTRTADTTVAPYSHAHVRTDLLARSMMSNALNPDLFVSIHHNSNIHHPRKNDLEVYYKLTDPGASREVAACVMKRLRDTFAIAPARVLPGNYSVLRNTGTTAILGEASYISHRQNEKRLSLHRFLKLEAEAYFLGILDYFARGVPRILDLTPRGDVCTQAQPEVTAWIEDEAHGKGIDPDSVKLYLDDVEVQHLYDPLTGKVSYIPPHPLAGGEHTLRLEARNRGGNSARPVRAVFSVKLPPATIAVSPMVATIPPDGRSRSRITATVLDGNRNPVTDGTMVTFSTSAGELTERLVPTSSGTAITHLVAGYLREEAEVVASCADLKGSCTVVFGTPDKGIVELSLVNGAGDPVEGAALACGKELCCTTDRLGYCFYRPDRGEEIPFSIWKDGYLPVKGSFSLQGREIMRESVVMQPLADGLWWNKTVVINPHSGQEGDEAGLQTARFLKEMLKLAGARAVLTREGDTISAPPQSVVMAESVNAHLLITLDSKKGSYLGYYFSSARGKLLARSIGRALDDVLSCKKVKLVESSDFTVVHSSMPAVVVNLDRRACKRLPRDKEERAWAEAQALYQGLCSYLQQIP